MKFIPRSDDTTDASTWTPRQALMRALAECDDWESVVVIARHKGSNDTRGIQCTKDRIERMGLLSDAMLYGWNKPEVT